MPKPPAQLDREIAEALAARQISDRRIAALIANDEDARNTVAWRDAMSERRMINIMSPKAKPAKRQARSGHTRVAITWYVVPNENKSRGGYMPVWEEGGKVHGDTYGRGYDKADAEQLAEARAHEMAARYVGDWNVVVKKGAKK